MHERTDTEPMDDLTIEFDGETYRLDAHSEHGDHGKWVLDCPWMDLVLRRRPGGYPAAHVARLRNSRPEAHDFKAPLDAVGAYEAVRHKCVSAVIAYETGGADEP